MKSITVVVIQNGVPIGSPYSFYPVGRGLSGSKLSKLSVDEKNKKLYVSVLSKY